MSGREQAERLLSNVRGLGTRRLVALGLVGLAVMLAIGFATVFLSEPERTPLYTGLSRDDVGRIGGVLKEYGVDFDVSEDGGTVLVGHADASRARMLLAEKGLPQSATSGYELFNQIGSFGLTSFMQDVTRTRALEGELARTIQSMNGVEAARVHIVLPDRGSFRTDSKAASASVVIRTSGPGEASSAAAIRYLVAAAVPGMRLDDVTVLDTSGAVLAASGDGSNAGAAQMAQLESQVDRDLEDKVRRTLAPYLGIADFRVSITSTLNTDRTKTSETIFDPSSRVERSVRTVKENALASNSSSANPTSVQQNIPDMPLPADGGKSSNEENQRRDEITNYEISSKTIETARDGYQVTRLSVALLINRERLVANAGTGLDAVPPETQIMEIEKLVASAVGLDQARGDTLEVSAVTFAENGTELAPVEGPGIVDLFSRQAGTLINALTILVVAVLLIWFGLKPALRAILARRDEGGLGTAIAMAGPTLDALPERNGEMQLESAEPNLIEDLTSRMVRGPQKRLEQMVEFDEEQAASILKQWLRQEEKS
jgi:flagellar M-ring protein FliF